MTRVTARAGWVADRFGVRLEPGAGSVRPLGELVQLALRRNPRRAHLLVSTVLGKHVPTDPRTVYAAGAELAALVAARLDGRLPYVIGYAETATGLGHVVAEVLQADYLHSTRRPVAGLDPVGGFEETHSHASAHLLLPEAPGLLDPSRPLVLVDDELSTGATALNTMTALHALAPRGHYLIAALADLRGPADRAAQEAAGRRLAARIDVVALATGTLHVPDGFADAAAQLAAGVVPASSPAPGRPLAPIEPVASHWLSAVRDGGRHGFTPADVQAAHAAARGSGAAVRAALGGERILVLGFEELMYAPLLIALELAETVPSVRFSSTTRSPVFVVDAPGYPIRTALCFPAHDDPVDGPGPRYAYNVAPPAGGDPFTDIVLVIDDAGATQQLHATDGLLAQLASVTACVHLVTLPSYRPVAVRTL